MRYFCYISPRLVGQLLDQADASYGKVAAEKREIASNLDASAKMDAQIPIIGNLLNGGLTFGRKSTVHRDLDTRKSLVEKLLHLIGVMSSQSKIEIFPQDESELSDKIGDFLFFSGSFRPTSPISKVPSNTVVDIVCDDGDLRIILACSIKNFSESAPENGDFVPHSGNKIFFIDQLPLRFDTVFQVNHYDAGNRTLHCSPIFLAIGDQMRPRHGGPIEL